MSNVTTGAFVALTVSVTFDVCGSVTLEGDGDAVVGGTTIVDAVLDVETNLRSALELAAAADVEACVDLDVSAESDGTLAVGGDAVVTVCATVDAISATASPSTEKSSHSEAGRSLMPMSPPALRSLSGSPPTPMAASSSLRSRSPAAQAVMEMAMAMGTATVVEMVTALAMATALEAVTPPFRTRPCPRRRAATSSHSCCLPSAS